MRAAKKKAVCVHVCNSPIALGCVFCACSCLFASAHACERLTVMTCFATGAVVCGGQSQRRCHGQSCRRNLVQLYVGFLLRLQKHSFMRRCAGRCARRILCLSHATRVREDHCQVCRAYDWQLVFPCRCPHTTQQLRATHCRYSTSEVRQLTRSLSPTTPTTHNSRLF